MKWLFGCAVLIGMFSVAENGMVGAQALSPASPRIEITASDELILKRDEIRSVLRDSAGNLITYPGDIIQYTLTATNTGLRPAHNVEIVDPIPEGTEYVIGSSTGEEMTISYSIDGERTYQLPPVVFDFRKADGEFEQRSALAGMYTHVKWLVMRPLPPGGRAVATLRVRVLPAETSEEAP